MGNVSSGGGGGANGSRRRRNGGLPNSHGPLPPSPPPVHQQHQQFPAPPAGPPPAPYPQEIRENRYLFAAETPYPPQYPAPNAAHQYLQYHGYYPPPPPPLPSPLPAPFDHHHRGAPPPPHGHHAPHPSWVAGYMSPPPPPPLPAVPYVEHQKAITIRNDVNLKKETLRMESDEKNPGRFLVAFTFDATIAGSITVMFFAKEGFDCNLTSMRENLLKPITVSFKEGLGQKFRQPSGTGIDFSMFEEVELLKEGETEVYPLAVKAEASTSSELEQIDNQKMGNPNSQITQAVFDKRENGEYQVRVVKQILWVNGTRYELQEIFGIANSVDSDFDGNDPGKECVICLSEPRDTTVLPCRHMCMCGGCAKVLGFQTNRCPICRQPIERLLEIKVNNKSDEQQQEAAS